MCTNIDQNYDKLKKNIKKKNHKLEDLIQIKNKTILRREMIENTLEKENESRVSEVLSMCISSIALIISVIGAFELTDNIKIIFLIVSFGILIYGGINMIKIHNENKRIQHNNKLKKEEIETLRIKEYIYKEFIEKIKLK